MSNISADECVSDAENARHPLPLPTWDIPRGTTARRVAAGMFVDSADARRLDQTLRSALRLTESNLRRLIDARHCDEVLMTPWLEEVRKALDFKVVT